MARAGGKVSDLCLFFLILPGGLHGELKLGGLIETISLFCVVLNEKNVRILLHSLFSL